MNGRRRHDRKQQAPEFETPGLDTSQTQHFPIPLHIAGDAMDRDRQEGLGVKLQITHFSKITEQE